MNQIRRVNDLIHLDVAFKVSRWQCRPYGERRGVVWRGVCGKRQRKLVDEWVVVWREEGGGSAWEGRGGVVWRGVC